MYLSLLKLNPSSRKVRVEAYRPYELHRSIMHAFPDKNNGGPGRVLFRLDIDQKTGNMSVLVQSEKKPDWTSLDNSGNFLLQPSQSKIFEPSISAGQVLYFRLRANPTVKRNDKRLGILTEEEQIKWLQRKGEDSGFVVVSLSVVPEGIAHDKTTDSSANQHDLSLLSVRFEGVLKVTDAQIFRKTVEKGIGSAKGFGFGLLSVASVRN